MEHHYDPPLSNKNMGENMTLEPDDDDVEAPLKGVRTSKGVGLEVSGEFSVSLAYDIKHGDMFNKGDKDWKKGNSHIGTRPATNLIKECKKMMQRDNGVLGWFISFMSRIVQRVGRLAKVASFKEKGLDD
nr:hypothetical protein Iba_chr14eCG8790 [Ipomoea batatas]